MRICMCVYVLVCVCVCVCEREREIERARERNLYLFGVAIDQPERRVQHLEHEVAPHTATALASVIGAPGKGVVQVKATTER